MTLAAWARTGEAQASPVDPLTITIPSGASAGHVAVLVVNADTTSATLTTPSGWTQIGSVENGSGNSQVWVYKKSLVSGDLGATTTLDFSTTVRCGAIMHCYSGRNFSTVSVNINIDSTATSTYIIPSATVTSGADLGAFIMRRRSGAAATIDTPGAPWGAISTGDYSNSHATGVNTFGNSFRQNAVTSGPQGGGSASSGGITSIGYNVLIVLPASASNSPPTANAGGDQLNVEPYSIIALVGTDSDIDGTVVTRTWTQTAGSPPITLSGTGASRIFEAPGTIAGTTYTFQYSVTDNGGATTSDSVNIQVMAVTERAVINGAEVAMKMSAVLSNSFLATQNNDIIALETGDPILI